MLTTISFIIFTVAIITVVMFQFALAAGKPWGEYSMGGKFKGKYPRKMKIVAVVNAIVLILLEIIVMIKLNYFLPQLKTFADKAIWFVVAFNILGTIMNTITPSKKERNIWVPVTFVMLITSIIIALS